MSIVAFCLIILIVVSPRKEPPTGPSNSSCLGAALLELSRYVNVTANPCTDFDRFTCSRRGREEIRAAARKRYLQTVVHPTYQSSCSGKVCKTMHAMYASCVRELLDPATTPEKLFDDITTALENIAGSARPDPAELVGVLDITYGLGILFRQAFHRLSGHNRISVALSPLQPRTQTVGWSFLKRLLTFLRRKNNLTATAGDIRELINLMSENSQNDSEKTLKGSTSLLSTLHPNVTLHSWQKSIDLLCECVSSDNAHVVVSAPGLLKAQLGVYADKDRRDHVTSYIIAVCSMELFDNIIHSSNETSRLPRIALCDSTLLKFYTHWDFVAIERGGSSEKDAMIRSLYDVIVKAAKHEIAELMGTSQAVSEVLTALSSMQVLDLQAVMSVYTPHLPAFQDVGIVRTRLAVRGFSVKKRVIDVSLGLQELWTSRDDVFWNEVIVFGRHVAFSPSVYAELRTDCGPDAMLFNAHVVGVDLADKLILRLFEEARLGRFGGSAFLDSIDCFHPGEWAQDTFHPFLAMNVVLRALAITKWRQQWGRVGTWKVSHDQLFFVAFYLHQLCPLDDQSSHSAEYHLQNFAQFRKAFNCGPPRPDAEHVDCPW
ncbi:hypothetical protein HPB48_004028 [Haemaphysalis longicornis]|uniref:Peptidase M13 N-terminal domain-containing protein n=1 Tax=Haemaphysalis longicornis TaxID=44386 RepID=A0A9J6FUI0_HAELO|nr:hypothetical protein HPB48_004028 [Haemaphysalis longicornis]